MRAGRMVAAASVGGAVLSAGLVLGPARAADRVELNLGSVTPPVVATVVGAVDTVCGSVDATPVAPQLQALNSLPGGAPCTPWSDPTTGTAGYNLVAGTTYQDDARHCAAIFVGVGFLLPSAFVTNGGC